MHILELLHSNKASVFLLGCCGQTAMVLHVSAFISLVIKE